jgi:hypothetical protein
LTAFFVSALPAIASAQPPPQPPPPLVYYPPQPPPAYYAPPPLVAQPVAPAREEPPLVVYNWDPDAPAPAGYQTVEHVNGRMIGVGIGLLSAGWLTSVFVAIVASSRDEDEPLDPDDADQATDYAALYIPVVGPFVALGTLDPPPSGAGLLVLDGIIQGAGVLGIVLGLVDTRTKLVRMAKAPKPVAAEIGPVQVRPALGPRLQGFTAKAAF